MRIGGAGITAQQESYGSRQNPAQPSVGVDRRSGLAALGNAVASLGSVGNDYLAIRMREEQEAEDYNDLLKRNTFEGEWARKAEGLKTNLPPDGRGYVNTLEAEYAKDREKFIQSISPRNRQQYTAWAEGIWQNTAINGDDYTRGQTRAHSDFTLTVATDEAQKAIYQNPNDLSPMDSVTEMVNAAPGLTAQERLAKARQMEMQLGGAAMAGTVRDTRVAAYAVPNSADVRTRIIPALVGIESNGDASAVSPKGALGLMQVMPGTGLEIARELGDSNFPYQGSEAERAEYLKRESVSLRYGEYYFNKQLKKYGGDIELAAIAYNAGPGRADEFVRSGRQWAAMPPGVQSETKAYVEKLFNAIGATTPDQAFNPEFGLSFEQALQAEGALTEAFQGAQTFAASLLEQARKDSEALVAQMKAEADASHASRMSDMYQRAEYEGANFPAEYQQLVESGQIVFDPEEASKGRSIYQRVNEKAIQYDTAASRVMAGEHLSPEEANLYISAPLLNQLENKVPEAMDQVVQKIDQVGFIPSQTEATLSRMLFSPDPEKINAAAQMIKSIEKENPTYTANLSEDVQMRANAYEALRNTQMPIDQIMERMQSTQTKEGREALARLKEVDDSYAEAKVLAPDDITGEVAGGFMSLLRAANPMAENPRLRVDPSSNALLQIQYSELYEAYYASTWDAATAKQQALTQLSKQWGVTDTGSQQIMYMPPEVALRQVRIDQDGDGQLDVVDLSPEYIRTRFDRQVRAILPEGQNFTIRSTPATKTAVDRGEPVPYFIQPVDEEGQPVWPTDSLDLITTPFYFRYDDVTKDDSRLIKGLAPLYRERERLGRLMTTMGSQKNMDVNAGVDLAKQQRALQDQIDELEKELNGE